MNRKISLMDRFSDRWFQPDASVDEWKVDRAWSEHIGRLRRADLEHTWGPVVEVVEP